MNKNRHICVRCGAKRFQQFMKHPIYFGVCHHMSWICKNPYRCYRLLEMKKKLDGK